MERPPLKVGRVIDAKAAFGPLRTFALLTCAARQRRAGAGCGAHVRRSPLRSDSPAMLGPAAPSRNSLRSLRSLRSDSRDESVFDPRFALGRGPCASRRLSCAPQPAPARLCCQECWRATVACRDIGGRRESGGPWSEVKEETAPGREPQARGRAQAGDMSGRGHPTPVAQGRCSRASSAHVDVRNGPGAEVAPPEPHERLT